MNEPKWTKGEWKVDLESGEITVNDSMVLGTIFGADDYLCCEEDISEECKANAQLIASAPKLYEALENLVNRIDKGLALGEKLDVEPARKALAKARGGN
jgi:hypothetical protein